SGQTAFDLVITAVADILVEGEETLDLTLAPGSYIIGEPSSAGVVIADDQPRVTVTALDGVAAEGTNAGTLRFERTGGNINQALTIFTTLDGTADVNDYTDNNSGVFRSFGQVTIGVGETIFDLVLTAAADQIDEGEETLVVSLAPGSYEIEGVGMAMLTILDTLVFSDSFEESGATGNMEKGCTLSDLDVAGDARFYSTGHTLHDLETGIAWLRCGIDGYYQWGQGICSRDEFASDFIRDLDPGDRMRDFNLGLIGDNTGFSDWRWATVAEQRSLGIDAGRCVVR
ncbi:MAG: hypothetical protein QNJ40_09685, partial [Xanthomonadales bacterium]|nr:hypothetical protein [Xanthomonadales bacterium]